MLNKMRVFAAQENVKFWGQFMMRTGFYLVVLLALVYLYHFCHVDGAGFIYNEF